MKKPSAAYAAALFIVLIAAATIGLLHTFQPQVAAVFKRTANGECVQAPSAQSAVTLPVIMYHSVLKSKQGKYIVSPTQFENDLVALQKDGYTTVTCQQLVDFVYGDGELPQKPVLITLDDGHYNNAYYAVPILQKYNAHAIINIVGQFSQHSTQSGDAHNPNYSHLTWDDIAELVRSGNVEIGNHTYAMHTFTPRYGVGRLNNESDTQYEQALTADVSKLQRILLERSGVNSIAFAYPFGKYSALSEKIILKMGFKLTFTCNEGVNVIVHGKPQSLTLLKRINRSGFFGTSTLLEKIKLSSNKQ